MGDTAKTVKKSSPAARALATLCSAETLLAALSEHKEVDPYEAGAAAVISSARLANGLGLPMEEFLGHVDRVIESRRERGERTVEPPAALCADGALDLETTLQELLDRPEAASHDVCEACGRPLT